MIAIEAEGLDEDKVMEDALEAGAADFSTDGDVFEIATEPDDFSAVREDLEAKGYALRLGGDRNGAGRLHGD